MSGNPCRASATFTGTLSGSTVTMTEDVSAQPAVFSGTVSADGNSATGTYTAPSGGCTRADTGRWSGTRTSTAMAGAGSMAHVASGGTWQTIFTLVNMGTSSGNAELSFFDDNGGPLVLPLLVMEGGTNTDESQILVNEGAAGGVRVIRTQGQDQAQTNRLGGRMSLVCFDTENLAWSQRSRIACRANSGGDPTWRPPSTLTVRRWR